MTLTTYLKGMSCKVFEILNSNCSTLKLIVSTLSKVNSLTKIVLLQL